MILDYSKRLIPVSPSLLATCLPAGKRSRPVAGLAVDRERGGVVLLPMH